MGDVMIGTGQPVAHNTGYSFVILDYKNTHVAKLPIAAKTGMNCHPTMMPGEKT
jgi:hypothetical protein